MTAVSPASNEIEAPTLSLLAKVYRNRALEGLSRNDMGLTLVHRRDHVRRWPPS